jgi:hypothetical protein
MSLGRLSRKPQDFQEFRGLFESDPVEHQLFENSLSQAQFRSQWKLEDYLQKLFEQASPHLAMPLDLHFFDPKDVCDGLGLFNTRRYHERLCHILGCLDFENLESWYRELFNPESFGEKEWNSYFDSLSHHTGVDFGRLVEESFAKIQKLNSPALTQKWFAALCACEPTPFNQIQNYLSSPDFLNLDTQFQIEAMNTVADLGLVTQVVGQSLESVSQILESVLQKEISKPTRGRVYRALGQLGKPGLQVHRGPAALQVLQELGRHLVAEGVDDQ